MFDMKHNIALRLELNRDNMWTKYIGNKYQYCKKQWEAK